MSIITDYKNNKKVFDVHNSNIPETIRNEKERKIEYSDKNILLLEEKMDKFQSFVNYFCNYEKCEELRKIVDTITSFYQIKYPDHLIDEVIDNRIKYGKNAEINLIPITYLFKALSEEQIMLINKEIKKSYKYTANKSNKRDISMEFTLDDDGIIHTNKMNYTLNLSSETKYKNLANDFDGLSLKKVEILLNKYNLTDAAEYISNIKKEYVYRKIIIDNLFNYIMYYMIEKSKSVESCKRALMFAIDFKNTYNIDLEIPMLYGMSYNDKNSLKFVKLYELHGGRMNTRCIPEYFSKCNKQIEKNNYPLHTYLSEYNKMTSKTKKK